MVETCSVTTGIARTRIPSEFRILLDSLMNSSSFLKCCADSSATTLSTELSANGSSLDVEFKHTILS